MLQSIYQEHRQMSQLLAVLTNIHRAIGKEQPVRFDLVRDIIDYLQDHAEHYHHPKEDLIYNHFKRYYPDQAMAVIQLSREHEELESITEEFMTAVQMVLFDAVIPLSVFYDKLGAYIERQRLHLHLEEQVILPKIAQYFGDDDWQELKAQWQHDHEDPLFGHHIDSKYRALAACLNTGIYQLALDQNAS
ncbi:hypothetical protein VST7929_00506 [Vibrio stylophorae]|uniref:Hemerythrin-like domain-containing protein n=1 Tax=Vibrio stylophorae TaxID=659351 RepID=A0ABM8ZRZ1_9VIBR|nr:hemerythrin domain-containing protein [Vibrio stylophorae]CAH0532665.1 hypothetical protein VST7929_00506 [Vibrio stylophorae]